MLVCIGCYGDRCVFSSQVCKTYSIESKKRKKEETNGGKLEKGGSRRREVAEDTKQAGEERNDGRKRHKDRKEGRASHLRNGLINAIDGMGVGGGGGAAAAERCGLIEIILTSSSNLSRGNTLQIHK